MQLVFLVVACALACGVEADEQMELDSSSNFVQDFMSYIVGFFEESDGISNEDCDYFAALGLFSDNRDIYMLSRLLYSWMCDSPITTLLAEIAQEKSQIMRMFSKVVESKPEEESKTRSNNAVKEVTITETPTTTVKKLAKEEIVLYVGPVKDGGSIYVYDLIDDSKGFTLRTTMGPAKSDWLLTDPAGNRLISVKQRDLMVYNLIGGVGTPTFIDYKNFNHATFDKNGKYLFASDYTNFPKMDVLQLTEDSSFTDIVSYNPEDSNDKFPETFAVHPKAKGILAVPYAGTNVVRFLQFDGDAKTIELLSPNAHVVDPYWVVFSNDGQYLYVTDNRDVIHAFKLTVDENKNEVTKVDLIGTFGTPQANTGDAVMVICPSGEFLYLLSSSTNTVLAYAIETPTGKLTPNDKQPTGGTDAHNMAISPSGTKLVVTDRVLGIVIFNIKEDGTLEPPTVISASEPLGALVFTKK